MNAYSLRWIWASHSDDYEESGLHKLNLFFQPKEVNVSPKRPGLSQPQRRKSWIYLV
jgi:hypothetical protein